MLLTDVQAPAGEAYYLPTCAFVGPYMAISWENGLTYVDHADYGDGDWSDEEFAAVYEGRPPDQRARTD